ncbi:MAG TPA: 3-oxoacyl-ACP reductase, partial [Balneolaceae bacterium]|nr:3-oxoacyl-ACP reductase [Balneolaceae bacterium]
MKDKVVLITGGAAGIGKATAEAFVEEEAVVVIWDVNEEKGNELAGSFLSSGKKSAFRKVDVTNLEDVEAGVAAIIDEFGKLDVLVNNAGITM